jgi:hypothetical protein
MSHELLTPLLLHGAWRTLARTAQVWRARRRIARWARGPYDPKERNSRSLLWMRHAIAQPIEYMPEAPGMGRCAVV